MADSREESMSDNDDSSIMMDDSQIDGPAKKGQQILPKDLLRPHFDADMEGDAIEEPRKSARDITGDKVDNTKRFDMLSKFKYGDLKLEDYHIKDVLDHLSKNRIF